MYFDKSFPNNRFNKLSLVCFYWQPFTGRCSCNIEYFSLALLQVTTENIACGSTSVTCSRRIEVIVGEPGTDTYYTLQLEAGQTVIPDPGSPFTVKEVGDFIYIETPFGLSLQWDQGTRIYVRLQSQHRNKVLNISFEISIMTLQH